MRFEPRNAQGQSLLRGFDRVYVRRRWERIARLAADDELEWLVDWPLLALKVATERLCNDRAECGVAFRGEPLGAGKDRRGKVDRGAHAPRLAALHHDATLLT